MTAKKIKLDEKGVLNADMEQLMTPQAVKELKDLSPTLQQFLLRWQDKRDMILGDQLKEELKDFLLEVYEKDNENLCKSVTMSVCKEFEEFMNNVYNKLASLDSGQADMLKILSEIHVNFSALEKRVDVIENKRLVKLESFIGWKRFIIRYSVVILISVGISISVFMVIINNKINDVKDLLMERLYPTEVVK